MKNFADRLLDEIERFQNPSCIGLDPRIEDIPDFIKKENERKYNCLLYTSDAADE